MVLVFLANGFEDTEAITTIDILRRAKLDCVTVSIGDDREVKSSHGITVLADTTASALPECSPEMIVLPGGGVGTKNLYESQFVREEIKKAYDRGIYIGAICAAPTILGRLGYLRERNAVCYPGMEGDLHCKSLGKYVVRDGNIITAAGMGVTVDFALALVAALCSDEKAAQIKTQIVAK